MKDRLKPKYKSRTNKPPSPFEAKTFSREQEDKRQSIMMKNQLEIQDNYKDTEDSNGFLSRVAKTKFDHPSFAKMQPPFVKIDDQMHDNTEPASPRSPLIEEELGLRPQRSSLLTTETKKVVD